MKSNVLTYFGTQLVENDATHIDLTELVVHGVDQDREDGAREYAVGVDARRVKFSCLPRIVPDYH